MDYPFNLTGILYFPKVKSNIELQKNKIQLYCNQVYVTDSVEGIVPDFLTLLHGVIDSPDIPLNVSRSHLLFFSCLCMDMGALTAFFYGFRDREKILDIFEATTGGRLIQNYNTIGGVQADIAPREPSTAA